MPRTRQSSGDPKSKKLRGTSPHSRRSILRATNVQDIAAMHPKATDILAAYGLHCAGCAFGSSDTLESGALSHGLGDEEIDSLVQDLEELLGSGSVPKKPRALTLTESGARALLSVAHGESKHQCLLAVTTDEHGGFYMEFRETSAPDEYRFGHPDVPGVALLASDITLSEIGGSTVDYREGRFKLDLAATGACACGKGECNCKNV